MKFTALAIATGALFLEGSMAKSTYDPAVEDTTFDEGIGSMVYDEDMSVIPFSFEGFEVADMWADLTEDEKNYAKLMVLRHILTNNDLELNIPEGVGEVEEGVGEDMDEDVEGTNLAQCAPCQRRCGGNYWGYGNGGNYGHGRGCGDCAWRHSSHGGPSSHRRRAHTHCHTHVVDNTCSSCTHNFVKPCRPLYRKVCTPVIKKVVKPCYTVVQDGCTSCGAMAPCFNKVGGGCARGCNTGCGAC